MLKCSSERCVCAPHSLSAATSTTPRLSVSCRVLVIAVLLGLALLSIGMSSARIEYQSGAGAAQSGRATAYNGTPRGLRAGFRGADGESGPRAASAQPILVSSITA